MRDFFLVLGLFVGVVVLVFFLRDCNPEIKVPVPLATTIIRHDTVVKFDTVVRVKKAIRIVNVYSTKVDTTRDSVVMDKPFIATLDTVESGDTITAQFQFPEKRFSLLMRMKPDSVITKTNTIAIEKVVFQQTPVMEKLGYGTVGFLFGAIVGAGVTLSLQN